MQTAVNIASPGVCSSVRSSAKINWTLRVLARRDDGFHEIESLMTAVTLFDELVFEAQTTSGPGQPGVELCCTFEEPCEPASVPIDQRNLVVQAATLLARRTGCSRGIRCRLTKRIPAAGGLGGASSNAASTLTALNRLWSLNWPLERLAPLAAKLGSDVPFFLAGGSAISSGRGEKIRPVRLPWRGWVVLLLPGFGVSTADVYRAWNSGEDHVLGPVTGPQHTGRLTATEWMAGTFNMLERPAMRVCPALQEVVERASALADRPVRVSGSGSTVFTAFDEKQEAERFARLVRGTLQIPTRIVQPLEGVSAD